MFSIDTNLVFYCSGVPPNLPSFPTRRSSDLAHWKPRPSPRGAAVVRLSDRGARRGLEPYERGATAAGPARSEEHTSELQSPVHLVCRLLLEKKKPIPHLRLSLNNRHSV